ncbi:hypothetical protein C1645_730828 [Glomus cerebriforme]|uniref:Uncharacterized protein n=1 Tax=Glomus cerebriforme TaxID=658196 RepID=A0A397TT04_9GLOM|nr:hypothetical protein C1645_730828 [Glomus cerebriforme]
MTTNTITNVETLSVKQNNNTSKSNNSSLNFSKIIAQGGFISFPNPYTFFNKKKPETKKDLKRKAAIQATADWNSLLIWARKQRGPYYDPTTRMYHVSHNSKRYFAGYTEQDAEAEDAASTSQTSQQKMNPNNQNNQFKPIASIHNSEIITKDIIQLGGNHMSTRVSHNGGRRPGRPRSKIKDII